MRGKTAPVQRCLTQPDRGVSRRPFKAVQSLQSNLLAEFERLRGGNLPNMYLIDVQKDQVEGVRELIRQATGASAELIPTVRARIARVNG